MAIPRRGDGELVVPGFVAASGVMVIASRVVDLLLNETAEVFDFVLLVGGVVILVVAVWQIVRIVRRRRAHAESTAPDQATR
jgi:hypothetical protein